MSARKSLLRLTETCWIEHHVLYPSHPPPQQTSPARWDIRASHVLYIWVRWNEVWCGLPNPRRTLDQILQCITGAKVQSRHCLLFISTIPAAHFICCLQFLWSLSLYRERCCNFRTSQPQLVHPGSRYLANISMQHGLVGRYGAKTSAEEDTINTGSFPQK